MRTSRGRSGRPRASESEHTNDDGLREARRDVAFENHVLRARTKSPPRRAPPGLTAPVADRPMHSRGLGEASCANPDAVEVPWVGASSPPASPVTRSRVVSWDSWAAMQTTPSSQTTHDTITFGSASKYRTPTNHSRDRRKKKESRETLARLRVRYNTMSPATRRFMARALKRVERILELILARRVARCFTYWRCQTLHNRALVEAQLARVCSEVAQPTIADSDHPSQVSARGWTSESRIHASSARQRLARAQARRNSHGVEGRYAPESVRTSLRPPPPRPSKLSREGAGGEDVSIIEKSSEEDNSFMAGVERRAGYRSRSRLRDQAQMQLLSREHMTVAKPARRYARAGSEEGSRYSEEHKEDPGDTCADLVAPSFRGLMSPRSKGVHVGAHIVQRVLARLVARDVSRAISTWKSNTLEAARDARLMRRIVQRWRQVSLDSAFAQWKRATRRTLSCIAIAPYLNCEVTSPTAVRRKDRLCIRVILRALNRRLYAAFTHWTRAIAQSKLESQARTFQHDRCELIMRQAILRIKHQNLARAFARWQHAVQRSRQMQWDQCTHDWQRAASRRVLLRLLRRQQAIAFRMWRIATWGAQTKVARMKRALLRLHHLRESMAFRTWADVLRVDKKKRAGGLFVRGLLRANRRTYLQQALFRWRLAAAADAGEARRRQRIMLRAARRMSSAQLNSGFQTWKARVHRGGLAAMKRLCVSFFSWKLATREGRSARALEAVERSAQHATARRFLRIFAHHKQHAALQKWKSETLHAAKMHETLRRMVSYRTTVAFTTWRSKVDKARRFAEIVRRSLGKRATLALRHALRTWQTVARRDVVLAKQERMMMRTLLQLSRSSVQRCFFVWREVSRRERRKRDIDLSRQMQLQGLRENRRLRLLREHLDVWAAKLDRDAQRSRFLRVWMRRAYLQTLARAWRRWSMTARLLTEAASLRGTHEEVIAARETLLEQTQMRVAKRILGRLRNRAASQAFASWVEMVRSRRAIKEAIERMRTKTLRGRFATWVAFGKAQKSGRLRKALLSWAQHVHARRVLSIFHQRSRAMRRKERVFRAWRNTLRAEKRLCRRVFATVKRVRLQEGFGALRLAASGRHARALEEENAALSHAQTMWTRAQRLRAVFGEWARVVGHTRRAEVLEVWRMRRAVRRLRGLCERARKRRGAEAFARERVLGTVLRRWRRHAHVRVAADDMALRRERRKLSARLATWRRAAVDLRTSRASRQAGLACLGATLRKWQTTALRRAFASLLRWAALVRGLKHALVVRDRVLHQYKQRAFLVWHTRSLYVDLAALRRHNRKLRQVSLRSKHAARVAEQEAMRTQAKAQALQIKVDRLLCRNHPRTEREQLAEDRYYKRRGPDAGQPCPLPARAPSPQGGAKDPRKKKKKAKRTSAEKLRVEIAAPQRAALHGSLSWAPPSPPPRGTPSRREAVCASMGRAEIQDLPLSPLMRSERELDALEDSIMMEVRDLSNSYGAVSLAASSAQASGYRGATFDPALEGLATKIIRKEEQLQMVGQTRKSMQRSMDMDSDDDGSDDGFPSRYY